MNENSHFGSVLCYDIDMRVLAIDYGGRRLGLAVSDPLGITAQPLMVLDRKEGDLMTTLKSVIAEYEVGRIVIGLPLNMDGSPAVLFDEIIGFVEQLKADTGLPVDTWDERLTSAQAERILLSADTSRKKRKRVIDKMAAAIILESYMAANPEIINSLRKANENSL